MSTTSEARTDFTTGLRALADALDTNPDLPLPYPGGDNCPVLIFCESQHQVAAFARLMTGRADKVVDDDGDRYGFALVGQVHGVRVKVLVDRDQVCERIVKGTREVTSEVLDPAALAAVPTVTVTQTVEDVVWECRPLLAEVSA